MKFRELSDEVKNRLIENNRYTYVEFGDWWEGVYDSIESDLGAIGFDEFQLTSFDLDRGRHIGFKFHYSWLPTVDVGAIRRELDEKTGEWIPHRGLSYIANTLITAGVLCAMKNPEPGFEMRVYGDNGSFQGVYRSDVDIDDLDDEEQEFYKDIIDSMERVMLDIESYALDMLDNELEYMTSDEYIRDALECHDVEYNEDGEEI